MKNSLNLATSFILLTGALVLSGAIVRNDVVLAGEGGAAGSISAQFSATGNNLTATSGAVAVGKTSGFTTARTSSNNISTVAVGNSFGTLPFGVPGFGVLGVNAQNVTYISIIPESAAQRGTAQGNTFTAAPTLNLVPATAGVSIP